MLILTDWSAITNPVIDFMARHKFFDVDLGHLITYATLLSLVFLIVTHKALENRQKKIAAIAPTKPAKKTNKRPYRRAMNKRK